MQTTREKWTRERRCKFACESYPRAISLQMALQTALQTCLQIRAGSTSEKIWQFPQSLEEDDIWVMVFQSNRVLSLHFQLLNQLDLK